MLACFLAPRLMCLWRTWAFVRMVCGILPVSRFSERMLTRGLIRSTLAHSAECRLGPIPQGLGRGMPSLEVAWFNSNKLTRESPPLHEECGGVRLPNDGTLADRAVVFPLWLCAFTQRWNTGR